ncbi:MAG: AMP-binding protein [Clostridia bacterium]|nr:AMP-binding protein [Clostridia bacterium]
MELKNKREDVNIREVKDFRELLNTTVLRYPDNIAYKYKKNSTDTEIITVTYSKFRKDVENLSTYLIDMGLEEKRIAVIGNNRYEWCVTYLAVTTGNMIIVPLDKSLPDNEIESLILRSGVEAIVFEEKYLEKILEIKENEKSKLKHLICMDKIKQEEITKFEETIKKGKELIQNGDKKYQNIQIDNEKMSIMLFTSGTTNEAKAVMLSQKNICSNVQAIVKQFKMYPTDNVLSFLPIHHTFECSITFLYGIYSGVTVAFCDGLKHIQKNLKEYEITVFVAVPLMLETMYKKIQKGIEEQGKTKIINIMVKISNALLKCKIDIRKKLFKPVLEKLGGKLRVVLYGAASMDKSTIIGYTSLGVELIQGYGLTETSPVICTETENLKRPGSVGIPLYNVEVKIENPNEEGIGEIIAKGPNIMLGYLDNEEATKEVLKDGWLRTGDYGYIDKDGFIYITGRKSDTIVLRNGKNIYPQEIEFLINKLPYVLENIVYERNKDKQDTLLCSKIVYDEEIIKETFGEKTQEEYKKEIWKHIKEINEKLPDFKHIKEINITKEPLIKTTTQKVKRFQEIKKMQEV